MRRLLVLAALLIAATSTAFAQTAKPAPRAPVPSAKPAAPFQEPDALNFFRDSGFTGGLPANFGGISIRACLISTINFVMAAWIGASSSPPLANMRLRA